MGVTTLLVACLLIQEAKPACTCEPTNTPVIDCFTTQAEPTSSCGSATLAITDQSFVFGCTSPQAISQNPAAGSSFFATTMKNGCSATEIIECFPSDLTVTPSWVYFDAAMSATTQTASDSVSASFSLWAQVPANTNSAQTVTVTSTYSGNVTTKTYTLGQCDPGPLVWTTAGFTIPAQTYGVPYNSDLVITTSSAARTLACVTCAPTFTYQVLVAGTFAAVSPSVFTSVTSTSITINTSSPQPDTSFVFRAIDSSVSPSLILDAPFSVTWSDPCSTTAFDASTFTVAAMTTEVTTPASAEVRLGKIFKDTASITMGNGDGFTHCSPRTYTFSGPAQASLFSFETATNEIVLAGPTSVSSYSATPLDITLTVCVTNYPTICRATTFQATIGCRIASAAFSSVSDQAYSTGASSYSVALPTVTLTPACPYAPVWQLQLNGAAHSNDEFLSLSSTTLQIGKTTTSISYMTPNPHTVGFRVSYASDPGPFSDLTSFQLTVTDSCQTTLLSRTTPLTDMTTSILVPITQDASMKDQKSSTIGNLDGTTLCGLRTYSMVVKDSSNNVVPAPPFISIDPSTGLITLNPNAPPATDVGSYTAEIQTSLVSYPSITDLTTINVVVNPCQVTSITHAPSTLANVNFVFLEDTSLGPFSYPVYTQAPACNYAYDFQIQVNGVTQTSPYLFLTYTSTDYTVATTDIALVGTSYAMTLVYSLLSYSYATVASDSTMTWTVAIKTTCFITALDPMGAFATMTTTVLAPTATTQAFTDVKDSKSKDYDPTPTSYEVTSNDPVVTSGPLVGTTFCGPRTYTITGGASCAALSITSNPSPYYLILNLSSSDPAQLTAGTSCTVTAKLQDHPLVAAVTNTVNVVINPCVVTSFTQDAPNLPTQFYTMMGTVLSVPFPTFTQTPTCNYVITYTCLVVVGGVASSYTTNPNLFSMSVCDTTNKLFTVNIEKGGALTTLNAQIPKAGDYQIQVTATLNNVPATVDSGFNFMLTVLNPCVSSNTIDATTVTSLASVPGTVMQDMTTSVKAAAVIQTFNAYKDYASRTYGNLNGLTLCGLRTYAVTQIVVGSFSAFSTWFTQPTAATNAINQVSINAQNDNDIAYSPNCNTMRLTVALQLYPSVILNQDFQVCIEPCLVTNFQENSVIADQSKIIYLDPPVTIPLPTYTQTPACGYTIIYSGTIDTGAVTALPNPALIPFVTTFDQLQYVIYSNSISHAGVYPMVLKATINQSYYPPISNSDVTWTLTLLDPCIGTVVNANSVVVADMQNSVKNVVPQQQIFSEFQSQAVVASLGVLNCGPVTYTLGGEYTGTNSWISFDEATRTISVATSNDADIKYTPTGHVVTLTACLDNYPAPATACAGPYTFYVKIVPCQVTSFSISLPQPSFSYNIFYPRNVQWIQPYVQTPECNYMQSYSATVQLGAGTPGDYTTFPWLTLDKTSKTPPAGLEPAWSVISQLATDEGVYTVVQTVTLNDVYYPTRTTLSVSFTISLVDPCKAPTSIIPQNGAGQTFSSTATASLVTTSVKFGTDLGPGIPKTLSFTFHDDTISVFLRAGNPGINFVCGPRKYTLTFNPPKAVGTQFQSVDETVPKLSIMTNNDLDIGVHRMELKVELTNYLLNVAPIYEYFTVKIESCIVKTITFSPADAWLPPGNSALDPIKLEIFKPSSVYLAGAVFQQSPNCGYPFQYTQQLVPLPGGPPEQKKWDPVLLSMVDTDTVAPSFSLLSTAVTPYQFEWKSYTAEDDKCAYGKYDALGILDKSACDPANMNPYHIQLVATLQNNPVPPENIVNPNSLATFNDAIKFYIWPKDPCHNSILYSAVPLTMLTFVNSTLPEKQTLATTKDSVSKGLSSSSEDEYCDKRDYSVTTVAGALVKFMTVSQGPPPSIRLATSNPFDAGVKKLLFKTKLVKYPHITTTAAFEVLIFYLEPCNPIGEQWYQVATDELRLPFSPYQIIPANLSYSIEYQLRVKTMKPNSTQITYRSDFEDLPKWIQFDPLQRVIIIFTTDATYFGNYTVQIVGKVTQYAFVESISEFLLHIILTPPPPQPNDPPFFTSDLKNGNFFWGEEWGYTLPSTDDHEGNKITQKILQKPDWLKYDAETKTFFVDEGATGLKTVGTYTVKITLTDTTTATQEYKFLVEVKPHEVVVVPYVDPDINRPKPVIDNINPKGLVTISWSKSMKTPRNITYIEKENTTYNDLASNIVDQKVPVMDVKVLRSKSSKEKKNLNFTWEIKSFQQKTLLIQLWFDDPLQISYEDLPEYLQIIFYEEAQFVGKEFGLPCKIGPEYNITKSISPQVSPKTVKKARTANNKMASTLATVGNVITQLMLSATLNQLWSLINTQQLIVMIPLFKIILPSNAAAFFAYVMQIAAFDVVPTDDIFGYIFQIPEGSLPDALNSNFDAVGFSTVYFFNNMGSLIFALISSPILAVVAKILFLFKNQPKFVRRAKKIERSIYWGSTLRVLLESYTVMVVCCAIQSTDYGFNSSTKWGPLLYSAVSIFYFAICFALPFFQAIFCYKNFDKLDDEKFEQKWGCLWEGMRITDKGFIAYNFVFLIRRLWLALSVVYSRHVLFFQIAGLVFQIIISCIVTGQTRPFEDAKTVNMEFFNEIMIMMVLYNFMCFTDWQPDEKVQYYQGYVACGITLAHIAVNLILMAQENIRLAFLRFKKFNQWRAYQKIHSEYMHSQQKMQRDMNFLQMRKFKIVDEARNIVVRKDPKEKMESIQEVEKSWEEEDDEGSQDKSYDYVKAEEHPSHSFSKSIQHEEQSLVKSEHEKQNEGICKQPEEAPKVAVEPRVDPVYEQHREVNRLLGETRQLDPVLGMEKQVHAKLGVTVGPDQVAIDPRAVMDELWGLDTQNQLNKQPATDKKDEYKLADEIKSKLFRTPEQDVGSFFKKELAPNMFKRKVMADRTKIHSQLFKKFKQGDAGAPLRALTEADANEIKEARAKRADPHDDGKFERVVSEILDKPEKPKLSRQYFGEMEFDFGEEQAKPHNEGEMEFDFGV